MRNLIIVAVILLVLVIATISLSAERVYVLRADDCLTLDVRHSDGFVVITGTVAHSNLGVGSTTIENDGRRAIVRVYLVPGGRAVSGAFRCSVPLSGTVEEIWFGDPQNVRTLATVAGQNLRLWVPRDESVGRRVWSRK